MFMEFAPIVIETKYKHKMKFCQVSCYVFKLTTVCNISLFAVKLLVFKV